MKNIFLPLIAASCVTETAAWGYGRVAWNGRNLIVPTNHNVRSYRYDLWFQYNYRLRIRNPWNACWLGAGVFTDHWYVWFNDFCGNNGWLTRCPRWQYNFQNCYHITRQGGYGGFGMASYGSSLTQMVWAARHPYGWPSNNYRQTNMVWMVFGNRHMGRFNWWCYIGNNGIADITHLDRWNYGGQLMLLRNLPGNPHAYMMEWTRRNSRSCWHRRNFYQWNVCSGSQVWGMTYVTGRRRLGWTYFTCKSQIGWSRRRNADSYQRNGLTRRNLYWSHHYRGQLRGVGNDYIRKPTTTTTTTTTTVPITMRTWSFPETLSWTIQETRRRKKVCRGGNYADWYVALKINGCKLKTGWHKITCSDKVKQGWHGAWLQVKNYKLCKKKFEWGAGKKKVEKFYVRA